MTTLQAEHVFIPTAPALATPELTLQVEISKTLAAYEEAVSQREQLKRSIDEAKANARRHRIRLPEVDRWDAYGYDDLGEAVVTLVRYDLQKEKGRPQQWLPVFEVQYQWEIPSSYKHEALFVTEKSKITRQIASVLKGISRRETLPFNHPLIVAHYDDLLEGLVTMRAALE